MERSVLLVQLTRQFSQLARVSALRDARDAGWPLPAPLAAHLWLYTCGLAGPTLVPPGTP